MHAIKVVATLLLVAVGMAGWAPSASGHSQLSGSTPAAGSTVPDTPTQVVLQFDAGVLPQYAESAVRVGAGEPTDAPVEVDNNTVTVDVAAITPPGVAFDQPIPWTVSYRVVSADGHPINGEVAFNAPLTPPVPAATTAEPSPTTSAPAPSAPAGRNPPTDSDTSDVTGADADEPDPEATTGVPLVAVLGAGAAALAAAAVLVLGRRRRNRSV